MLAAVRSALLLLLACATSSTPAFADDEAPHPNEEELFALEDAALALFLERTIRWTSIVDPMRIEAAEYCGLNLSPVLGAVVWIKGRLPHGLAAPAERRFELGKRPRFVHILEGSAAAAAGLQVGDEVLRFRGRRDPGLETIVSARMARSNRSVPIRILRDGLEIDLEIPPRWGCRPAPVVETIPYWNATVGHHQVSVWYGMFRLDPSDDELAVIAGHEFGHVAQIRGRGPAGEAENDYLGVYLAARLGYDPSVAPALWAKQAGHIPLSAGGRRTTHPYSREREDALKKAIAEIEAKQEGGEALRPEPFQ